MVYSVHVYNYDKLSGGPKKRKLCYNVNNGTERREDNRSMYRCVWQNRKIEKHEKLKRRKIKQNTKIMNVKKTSGRQITKS
ncbi:hypothetical protein XELAEV_18031776mg [Xenopus laevis]|uniref:Uncharacterized protein n=1 Tax=Xenopus laevis TaxID=8355 RepID=A0A974CNY0_XENLA|nr:hypothetical protein XELAEV_18031776mg [Xenopus laevis]